MLCYTNFALESFIQKMQSQTFWDFPSAAILRPFVTRPELEIT